MLECTHFAVYLFVVILYHFPPTIRAVSDGYVLAKESIVNLQCIIQIINNSPVLGTLVNKVNLDKFLLGVVENKMFAVFGIDICKVYLTDISQARKPYNIQEVIIVDIIIVGYF
jgi:hypothetical protein